MSTFGKIKTNIENTAVELAKKPTFKRFINEFNVMVLNNKDLTELYYIYDDLTENKGLDRDLANDYINESIEYSQILIESQKSNIEDLNTWITSWNDNTKNNYKDIDNIIYNTSIKNLESILESKKNIKNILTTETKRVDVTETFELPISSQIKIANDSLKKEIQNLTLSEQKEVEDILSISFDNLEKEMVDLKETVVKNLKNTLNESKDVDLTESINQTINKVMGSKVTHYDYYKLKKLSLGL